MLYNPRDHVVVRSDLDPDERYYMEDRSEGNIATTEMIHLGGEIVTISEVFCGQYRISELEGFLWVDEMFDGLFEEFEDLPKLTAEDWQLLGITQLPVSLSQKRNSSNM